MYIDQVRIVILGSNQVGKSALTVRFLTRRYISEYANGTDSAYVRTVLLNGANVDLKIIDSGMMKDPTDLIRWADGFILMYAITERKTFEHLKLIRDIIDAMKAESTLPPVVLVGNKLDLKRQRQVSSLEGQEFARAMHSVLFELAVSREIDSVREVFLHLTQRILQWKEHVVRIEGSPSMRTIATPEIAKRTFSKLQRRKRGRTKTL